MVRVMSSPPPHRDAPLSLSRRQQLRARLSAVMSKIKQKLGKLKQKIGDQVDDLQGDLSRLKVAAAVSIRLKLTVPRSPFYARA